MTFRGGLLICGVLVLLAGESARAQEPDSPPETGSRLSRPDRSDDSLRGARVLWAFSDCLVRRQPDDVDAYLATAPGSPQANEIVADLVNQGRSSTCLGRAGAFRIGEMRMTPRAFRGSLSEARYRSLYPDQPAAGLARLEPIEIATPAFNARVTTAAEPVDEIIRIFGECVVAARPIEVDALIRTELGSDAEWAALDALYDAMDSCLWQGQSVEFNRENLRGALAEALYRTTRAHAGSDGG